MRPGYAIKAGRALKIKGVYRLGYRKDGKRIWEPVGTDSALALVKLTAKKREFEDAKLEGKASRTGTGAS